jgi:hypothetical protein
MSGTPPLSSSSPRPERFTLKRQKEHIDEMDILGADLSQLSTHNQGSDQATFTHSASSSSLTLPQTDTTLFSIGSTGTNQSKTKKTQHHFKPHTQQSSHSNSRSPFSLGTPLPASASPLFSFTIIPQAENQDLAALAQELGKHAVINRKNAHHTADTKEANREFEAQIRDLYAENFSLGDTHNSTARTGDVEMSLPKPQSKRTRFTNETDLDDLICELRNLHESETPPRSHTSTPAPPFTDDQEDR